MTTRASPVGRIASEFDVQKVVKLIAERDALTGTLGVLYNDFDNNHDFDIVQFINGQTKSKRVMLPAYLLELLREGLDKRIEEIKANLYGAYGLDDNAP